MRNCIPPSKTVLEVIKSLFHDLLELGSSVLGDSLGKNTGVGSMPSSRGSSQPRDCTQVSCIMGGFFTIWATGEAHHKYKAYIYYTVSGIL